MTGGNDTIRVLHVDDEPSIPDLVATSLEREDDRFTVVTASDAEEGLDILSTDDIDCIVSDYDMPGQNGIDFLETVREDHPNLPFILYTGKGSEEVASEAISAGVTDYLQKESGTDQYTILANRITNAVAQDRAVQEANQARAYFGTLLEHSSDYVMVVGTSGEVDYISPAVERILGYTPDELEGSNSFDLMHPDDRTAAVDEFADILEHPADEHSVEFRVRHADGSWRWLEVRGRNRLDDPVIEGIIVNARDITERKIREQEFRKHERRYQAVFNDPNILVGLLDTDGTVIDINETALGYVDADIDEVTGGPFWETPWFSGDATIQQRVRDWVEQAAAGEYVEFEIDLSETVPDQLVVSGVVRPVRNDAGEVVSLLFSDRDITERKRHAEQLRALNEQSRMLMTAETREQIADIGVEAARDVLGLEATSTHLYDADQSGLVSVAATDTITDLVGEPPVFTGGDSLAWRAYEDGQALAFNDLQDEPDIYNPETPIRSELLLPLGDHGVMLAGAPEPEAFDREDFVLGKILAGNIASALDEVAQTERLREREAELTRQNDRLEEFASIVSHDLQSPLNVAEGRLELAREDAESEHLESVDRALDRMDALIDNILTLAREGETVSDLEPVDLSALAEGCWTHVETAGATLITHIDRAIYADESRVKQVFENLIRNAVEHAGDDVTVTIGELEDGFYVADDGPGIPEENRGEVFEVGRSTKDDGTGFGLSIVEQIVDAHDWDITVTEGGQGGARFEITGVEFVTD